VKNLLTLIQEEVTSVLSEGLYDKGALKAVFLAGGPGSGKSYVTNKIFGYKPGRMNTLTGSGLKMSNSDTVYTILLRQAGINPSELGKLSPEEFHKINRGPGSARVVAKDKTNRLLSSYARERIGLIIDGTGGDYGITNGIREELVKQGYDCAMIFVYTSLETALDRNEKRDRVLPADLTSNLWHQCVAKINRYKNDFGEENFFVVNNDTKDLPDAGIEFTPIKEVTSLMNSFINKEVVNPIGLHWKRNQLLSRIEKDS